MAKYVAQSKSSLHWTDLSVNERDRLGTIIFISRMKKLSSKWVPKGYFMQSIGLRHDVEGNVLLPPAHARLRSTPRKTSREAGLYFRWKKTKISISRSALQCKCLDLYHSICHWWWQISYLLKPCHQIELQVSPFLSLCSQQNSARNKTWVSQKPPPARLVVEGSGSSCAPWHSSSLD